MRYKSEETMQKILEATEQYFFAHQKTPTITQLAAIVGRSISTVHSYLVEMTKQGQLSYDGVSLSTPVTRKANQSIRLSPIVGAVTCGEPQYQEEHFEEYVALPTALFGDEETFILRASGESMIEAGIDPGDLVVVRKQNTAKEGDIIVALVENETTLKRFYLDEEHHRIRLHPENRSMSDIYVDECFIQGVAQQVIKRLASS